MGELYLNPIPHPERYPYFGSNYKFIKYETRLMVTLESFIYLPKGGQDGPYHDLLPRFDCLVDSGHWSWKVIAGGLIQDLSIFNQEEVYEISCPGQGMWLCALALADHHVSMVSINIISQECTITTFNKTANVYGSTSSAVPDSGGCILMLQINSIVKEKELSISDRLI